MDDMARELYEVKNAMLFLDLATNINSSLDIDQVLNNLTVTTCDKLGLKGAIDGFSMMTGKN